MTIYNPSIFIQRARFTYGTRVVYDEKFHMGINIIAGENSVGKTSIIQLIMHGLGYKIEDAHWKVEAKKCNVFLELKINGMEITIKRDSRESYDSYQIPMLFCLKNMDQALNENIESWERFPYNQTDTKVSFSTHLFNLLGIPSVKESDGIINLNNIFRLLYSAQERPVGRLFNYQPFSSNQKQEGIANFLLNTYDDHATTLKQQLDLATKELDKFNNEVNSFHKVAQQFSQNFVMDGITQSTITENIQEIESEIASKINEITSLQLKSIDTLDVDAEKKEIIGDNKKLSSIKKQISQVQQNISFIEYDIFDSKSFISEIKKTYDSIHDAIKLSNSFKLPSFSHCPCCFTLLSDKDIDINEKCCNLCHTDISTKELNLLQMQHELKMQISESTSLVQIKELMLNEQKKALRDLNKNLKTAINELKIISSSINTANDKQIYLVYEEIAKLQSRIKDLEKSKEAYNYISEITDKRDKAQKAVTDIKSELDSLSSQFEKKSKNNEKTIKEFLCELLKNDISDEDFHNIRSIDLDFGNDSLVLNQKSLSASSTGYLYHSLLVALLLSSLKLDYLRIPRLVIIDGLDSNGIDQDRLKNFQDVIQSQLKEYDDIEHQLFFTTGIVADELKDKIVGKFYSKGEHSLNFVSPQPPAE